MHAVATQKEKEQRRRVLIKLGTIIRAIVAADAAIPKWCIAALAREQIHCIQVLGFCLLACCALFTVSLLMDQDSSYRICS
jgi:hypothetical protein